MKKRYGVSFSLKRALGLSALKQRVARQIGIPLTRQGRQRKLGKAIFSLFPGGKKRR